jgi:glycosyltransferase involved in cell wall biosynthesis
VLLYVGRFELRKGVDLLLNCLPALLAAYPDLEVRLVGHHDIIVNGGTLKDQFLRAHAGLPGLDRVKFLGAVSETELHQEYAQCSLFVAPSRYESFGLIYLEAMRYGKPCIGSDAGGIPDVLTPDVGLLPQAGNQEALLQAICTLLDHPEQAAQMGRAGRQRFVAQYSMPAFLARLTPVLMTHAGI